MANELKKAGLPKSICYTRRKQHYERYLNRLNRAFSRYVRLKLTALTVSLAMAGYFLARRAFPISGGLIGLAILLLIYLDIGHRRIIWRREHAAVLRDINDHSSWRLDGRWVAFKDTGADFQDDSHPYASDLDIFGRGSLFQWINVTRTYLGRRRLSRILTAPPEALSVIRERQAAIAELAPKLHWRQWFLAYGIAASSQMRDPEFLLQWVNDRNPRLLRNPVVSGLRALPVLTVGMILVYYQTKAIPVYLPILMLLLQYGLLKIGSRKRAAILMKAGAYEKNLQLYGNLIRQILKKDYQTPYLQNLKRKLFSQGRKSASQQLKKLAKIVDWLTIRYNFLYSLINNITLMDYQCLIALERWKEEAGSSLPDWLETIAEFEALASLAIIGHDHPDWATPLIVAGNPLVKAEQLGHPLIPDPARVTNPLQIGEQTRALLITGSNMSGKSTYLRTAGINLVLAFAGAPVCAASFQCSLFALYTCMRVSDNLEKNISSFYAEILRIKAIVAAAAGTRPLFFLLDEIFKGTNSFDRHTGAKILIKKLLQHKTIGLVSTHDLELGELAQELATVANYHFQEHFQDDKLRFDYQLQPGISTTRNALYLMKAAGIMVDEERHGDGS
jgi:hypothetical protein